MIRTAAHKETRPGFLPGQIVAPITGHFPMGPSEGPPLECADPKPEALAMPSPVGGFAYTIGDDEEID